MSHKVIFLDIDGVLNTTNDIELIGNAFEINKLKNIIKLSNDVNASIIIISDRRLFLEEREMIDDAFMQFNKQIDYLSLKRTHKKRSDEIIYYINNNVVDNYVILDDCDCGYSNSILESHFINTHINGFTYDKYDLAKEVLNNKSYYQLKIDNKIIGVFPFETARKKALDVLYNHIINEDQAFTFEMPFSASSNLSYLYDNRFILDEEIVAFERIRMMLQDLISIEGTNNRQIDYINKDYECHSNLKDLIYDCHIIKKQGELVLELNSDYDDYLYTNMFNMIDGFKYYFSSRQEIVIKELDSKRELGEIVKLDVALIPNK